MKFKSLIIALFCPLLLLLSTNVKAQKPQYIRNCSNGPSATKSWGGLSPAPFNDTTPRKQQNIYYTRTFTPKVPRGYITAVYMKAASKDYLYFSNVRPRIGYGYNVSISLGWTKKNNFSLVAPIYPNSRDTFLPEGTLVFKAESVRINYDDSGGRWIRLPVNQNAFLFDTTQGMNLTVTFKYGPPWVTNYFVFVDTCRGEPGTRLTGYDTSDIVYGLPKSEMASTGNMEFGFDLNPLGVSSASFGGQFSVFPNPAKGGINIRVEGQKSYNNLGISIRNLAGQTVFFSDYHPKSASYQEYIPLPNMAKGMYFVELNADGERAVQRVLLE